MKARARAVRRMSLRGTAGGLHLAIGLLALAAILVAGVPRAVAQDASVELLRPAEEPYRNEGPLILRIPDGLPEIDYATLQIDLDQIDVTTQVERDGERYRVTPPTPLAEGLHFIEVLAFTTGGQFVSLYSATFEVDPREQAPQAPLTEPEGAATADAEGAQAPGYAATSTNSVEVLGRGIYDGTVEDGRQAAVSGAGDTRYRTDRGTWGASAGTTYFLESDPDARLTDAPFDIGHYSARLTGGGGPVTAGVTGGHHGPGFDSLAFSDDLRRGVSLDGGAADQSVRGQVFSFAAEPRIGASDPFGLAERSGQITGAALSAQPFGFEEDNLRITGYAFGGEEGETGFAASEPNGASAFDTDAGDGHGWGLLADSSWLDERLHLDVEFARTDHDVDGPGNVEAETGTALGAGASYDVVRDGLLLGTPIDLEVGARWERVETFFGSIANQVVAPDREGVTADTAVTWGGLFTAFQARQQTNNVDDLPGLPTDRLTGAGLNGQYNVPIGPQNSGLQDALGAPFITFGAARDSLDRVTTPAGYVGPDTDSDLTYWYAGLGSSYALWTWQVQHQRSDLEDHADSDLSVASETTTASAFWTVSPRVSLSASAQYIDSDAGQAGADNTAFNGTLGGDFVLVPERLDLSLDYTLNLFDGGNDLPDGHIMAGELTWRPQLARPNRPGVEVGLRGYMDTSGGAGNEDETYETYLFVRLVAPFSR